mgnify:CR=1 FL=1
MAEAVAIVETVADALVEFVLFDIALLDVQGGPDVIAHHCPIGEQAPVIGGDAVKCAGPFDGVDLDHFANPGAHVAFI